MRLSILAAFFLFVIACGSATPDATTAPAASGSGAFQTAIAEGQATIFAQNTTIAIQSIPPTRVILPTAVATNTRTPTAAPTVVTNRIGKVGERIEDSGVAMQVIRVSRNAQLDQFTKAKAGYIFEVVEVLIESTTAKDAPYNPFYFKVKDSEGFEYDSTYGTPDALHSGNLNPGEKARGTVPFEVKSNATGLVLAYSPVILFGGYTIRFALS